jgi:amino-acid N-acetyltransferase
VNKYICGNTTVSTESQEYVSWFRRSSPYINAHRGKTFVLMFGGEAVEDPNFAHIIQDIALLGSLGVRLVLVHGSRPQIEQRLALRQLDSHYHKGVRITDEVALECVVDACGSLRAQLEALLSMGLPNSPMHLSRIRVTSGNFVIARPLGIVDGIDFQHTGEVRRIHGEDVARQLDLRNVVLVSPLGYSPTGEIFNLSMEDVAQQLAVALAADKLIAFGAERGILNEHGELLRDLRLSEASYLYQRLAPDTGGSLLPALIKTSQAGIERCHLISYSEDGALLKELFSRDGCGSLIYQDSYESIRSASIDDVGGILQLIQPLEEQGVLVRRSRELLENEITRFTVIERDGMIIACAALYPFPRERSGEIACVATHPDYRGDSRGERLLSHLEQEARSQGLLNLFVLTTRTAHWFLEQGYSSGGPQDLPEMKQQLYNYQRNSRVFCKAL